MLYYRSKAPSSYIINMKRLIQIFFLVLTVSCNQERHNENSLEIDYNIEDIIMDECIDTFIVKPIKSEYPLSPLFSVQTVDKQYFLESDDDKIIYYMRNDSIISKLDAFGRGRGEYQSISGFAYSERDSILYVASAGQSKILCYSVPSFSFINSFECELCVTTMTYANGNIIAICHTESIDSPKKNGVYEINPITRNYKLLLSLDYLSSVSMGNESFSYYNDELYIVVPGYDNAIYKYNKEGLERTNEFHYGILNLSRDFFEIDERKTIQLFEKISELFEKEYCLGGCFSIPIDSTHYAFWRANGDGKDLQVIFTIVADSQSKSYSIKIPGLSLSVIPYCVSEGWNICIVEGPSESILDSEKELSGIGLEIINSLKKQSFDNPILLYFKLKDDLWQIPKENML